MGSYLPCSYIYLSCEEYFAMCVHCNSSTKNIPGMHDCNESMRWRKTKQALVNNIAAVVEKAKPASCPWLGRFE